MFKSNSFVTLNDTNYNYVKTNNKLREYDVFQKKIVDSLQDFRKSTIMEVNGDNLDQHMLRINHSNYGGSVPDFKKVFISDYL